MTAAQPARLTWRSAVRGLAGLSKAALGRDTADDTTRRQRRRTCAACPEARHTRVAHRLAVLTPASTCGVCRCNLHAKTRLAGESCPQGKW